MNKKQERSNTCIRLYVNNSYRLDYNSIRINIHNDILHEIGKLKKAYELIKDGKRILTEVIFKNGTRADILVPEDFRVIEILHSESEKEVLEKIKSYPEGLEVIYFSTEEI